MKLIKYILVAMILPCCMVEGQVNESDQKDFKLRLSKLHTKIDAVAGALEKVEGFPKKAGLIDLQVARFFAEYVAWELEHPELMTEALGSSEYFKRIDLDESECLRRYRSHINRELTGSMEILDQALKRTGSNKKWPKVKEIQWDKVVYQDNFFRVGGEPVFFGGFNLLLSMGVTGKTQFPGWEKKDDEYIKDFLPKMRKIGVGILGSGTSVPGLLQKDGTVNKAAIEKRAQTIRQYGEMGFKVDVMLSWGENKETLEKFWPGITAYRANGVPLDIDHPGTRVMITKVMAELMPEFKKLDAIASWDLANEPFFDMEMWSAHSLRKYHAWLAKQHGTIKKLNTVWKTSYRNFAEIPLPKDFPDKQCSPGQWHDRVTFHSRRVTDFFEFVQSQIVKYIPDAVVHLKGQDNSSLGPLDGAVNDGIDREMLTPSASLHGLDTRPLPVTEKRMAAGNKGTNPNEILHYDDSPYGFHWLGQSFLYDYLTSLKPYRPIIDFEYHAFSINAIRIPDMKQSHASASLWLAHLHGLVGNMAWYWQQRFGPYPFPHEHFKVWFYGSLSAQPRVATEYFQTMLKLNAFSKEVEALASVDKKPVRLFVSKPSYIQNRSHIDALHRVYEGTCFHGLRIGFLTEQELARSGADGDCKMIIIPDTEFVSAEALKALGKAKKSGVQLIRFGKIKTTRDAHGLAHPPELIAFLKEVPVVDYADARALSNQFEKLLKPITSDLKVRVTHTDGPHAGLHAFGVMHRQAVVNGKRVMLLINVSDKPVNVQLRSKESHFIDGFDMLNSEPVKGADIKLSFQGVRLITPSL
jgi:hypothetical protein